VRERIHPVWERLSERLEGRLVVLEPLERRHEEPLWEAAADPDVWRFMTAVAGASRQDFRGWVEEALAGAARGERVPFATVLRDGRPVGSTSFLTLRPEHRGLEIGHTWLARPAWGTGANAEAKLLLLEHAFGELDCIRVEFKTDARNERARAALVAIPARFEGIHRKHMLVRGGELRDSAYYAVTDDEWPAVRDALRARVAARL
jgi:RimJ/RimL family protein N-acetyltransferase